MSNNKRNYESHFMAEMSERQISAREFFSTVLLESLEKNFGLKNAMIFIFDTEGEFLSWITKAGARIAGEEHPYSRFFQYDNIRKTIYEEAVKDGLTYFNTEPRIYRATDYFKSDQYKSSKYAKFLQRECNAYYTVSLAFGINAYIQIVFFKTKEEGDFSDEEIEKFTDIYRYIAVSYKGFKKHEQSKIVSNIKDEIICCGERAYLITDDFMHVMSHNKEAEDLLIEILGKTVSTQMSSGEPCLWLPFLLEGKEGEIKEGVVVIKEIKNFIFKIYTYDQTYSHGIIDRYHWITITKSFDNAKEEQLKTGTHLTATERKVAKLLCEGLTYKAVADEMMVSYHTVKNHVQNIFTKCDVGNRYEMYKKLKNIL